MLSRANQTRQRTMTKLQCERYKWRQYSSLYWARSILCCPDDALERRVELTVPRSKFAVCCIFICCRSMEQTWRASTSRKNWCTNTRRLSMDSLPVLHLFSSKKTLKLHPAWLKLIVVNFCLQRGAELPDFSRANACNWEHLRLLGFFQS